MSLTHDQIILRPLITEKSTSQVSTDKKYTFEVPKSATKFQIREAIEEMFPEVTVTKINTCSMFGSSKRTAKGIRAPKDSKKAIVTIDGPHIECFPEV